MPTLGTWDYLTEKSKQVFLEYGRIYSLYPSQF